MVTTVAVGRKGDCLMKILDVSSESFGSNVQRVNFSVRCSCNRKENAIRKGLAAPSTDVVKLLGMIRKDQSPLGSFPDDCVDTKGCGNGFEGPSERSGRDLLLESNLGLHKYSALGAQQLQFLHDKGRRYIAHRL